MSKEEEFDTDEINLFRRVVAGQVQEVAVIGATDGPGLMVTERAETVLDCVRDLLERDDCAVVIIQKVEGVYSIKILDEVP